MTKWLTFSDVTPSTVPEMHVPAKTQIDSLPYETLCYNWPFTWKACFVLAHSTLNYKRQILLIPTLSSWPP